MADQHLIDHVLGNRQAVTAIDRRWVRSTAGAIVTDEALELTIRLQRKLEFQLAWLPARVGVLDGFVTISTTAMSPGFSLSVASLRGDRVPSGPPEVAGRNRLIPSPTTSGAGCPQVT